MKIGFGSARISGEEGRVTVEANEVSEEDMVRGGQGGQGRGATGDTGDTNYTT